MKSSIRTAIALTTMALVLASTRPSAAEPPDRSIDALQQAIDGLRDRLTLATPVAVEIVASEVRLAAVAPAVDGQPFTIRLASDFLHELAADELTAALAHELGHVWVSTHHPYLQTERLANDVAMRVVTRDSLARLYRKLWQRTGEVADVDVFLGPEVLRVTRHNPSN